MGFVSFLLVDGKLIAFVHLEELLLKHCSVQVNRILVLWRRWLASCLSLVLIVRELDSVVSPVVLVKLSFFYLLFVSIDYVFYARILVNFFLLLFGGFCRFEERWNHGLCDLKVKEVFNDCSFDRKGLLCDRLHVFPDRRQLSKFELLAEDQEEVACHALQLAIQLDSVQIRLSHKLLQNCGTCLRVGLHENVCYQRRQLLLNTGNKCLQFFVFDHLAWRAFLLLRQWCIDRASLEVAMEALHSLLL